MSSKGWEPFPPAASEAPPYELAIELAVRDARAKLGRELTALKAKLARCRALSNSRRWPVLADLLAASGRAFVEELAKKVTATASDGSAWASYSAAVESFLTELDDAYEREWVATRPFRTADGPPPAAWQDARPACELALRVQQSEFSSAERARAAEGDRAHDPVRRWNLPGKRVDDGHPERMWDQNDLKAFAIECVAAGKNQGQMVDMAEDRWPDPATRPGRKDIREAHREAMTAAGKSVRAGKPPTPP
jgi:hypothetical protein